MGAYDSIDDDSNSSISSDLVGPVLPALGHAVAGSLATASVKALLYPLDLIIARLQVQRHLHKSRKSPTAIRDVEVEYRDFIDAAKKIFEHEGGIKAFYTGCLPDISKGILDSFLFFLAYKFIRPNQLRRHNRGDLSVVQDLGVGITAGAFVKIVTTPLQNVIMRQQTAALVAPRQTTSDGETEESITLSVQAIARQIYRERGLSGFWAGYSASSLLTLNPAITFAVDNLLRRLLPKSKQAIVSPQLTFLIAAISKAIATSITYPIMLVKSRAQAGTPRTVIRADDRTVYDEGLDEVLGQPKSSADLNGEKTQAQIRRALRLFYGQYQVLVALTSTYHTEGIVGLYSGLEAEMLKGFLSHGLTMTIKERMHVGVIELFYLFMSLMKPKET